MSDIVIETIQPVGILDESSLDPANQSSGSATLGQVPSADGAGGITWSDEIGPVPSGRQILNGTGITGGGDLTADRTLAVVQSALDPANMGSGAAAVGQAPLANGAGGIAWGDVTAGVTGPVSSTDDALARYDGTTGGAIKNSGVTLSNTGAMVFPTAGSISKPGAGTTSEAFGASATAAGNLSVAAGQSASSVADEGTVVGQGSTIGTGSDGAVVVGQNTNAGQSNAGAVAIGRNVVVANSLGAVIVIGDDSSLLTGATNSVLIGVARDLDKADTVAIGTTTTVQGTKCVCIGQTSQTSGNNGVAVGETANAGLESTCIGQSGLVDGSYSVGVGQNVTARATYGVAIGHDVIIGSTATEAVSVGRVSRVDDAGCIAVGYNARTASGATYGIALGHDADVVTAHNNAVSIGRSAQTTAAGRCTIGTIGGSYDLELQAGKGLGVFGVAPPASQPAKVNDPSGGATVDAESRTAINAIIDILEGAGLVSAT